MKWKKFTVKTITDAEDVIISTLYDIGLEGAQIEDKVPLTPLEKEQMFVDILPDGPEDDGIAYLSFFVEVCDENPVDADEITASIRRELVKVQLWSPRRRILTGLTTGSSFFTSFILMTCW